jgi:hypothetical protein
MTLRHGQLAPSTATRPAKARISSKLNLVFEGAGAVRLKEIEILATPLEPW